jgi:hypothetical protein
MEGSRPHKGEDRLRRPAAPRFLEVSHADGRTDHEVGGRLRAGISGGTRRPLALVRRTPRRPPGAGSGASKACGQGRQRSQQGGHQPQGRQAALQPSSSAAALSLHRCTRCRQCVQCVQCSAMQCNAGWSGWLQRCNDATTRAASWPVRPLLLARSAACLPLWPIARATRAKACSPMLYPYRTINRLLLAPAASQRVAPPAEPGNAAFRPGPCEHKALVVSFQGKNTTSTEVYWPGLPWASMY